MRSKLSRPFPIPIIQPRLAERYVQIFSLLLLGVWLLVGLIHDSRLLRRGYSSVPFWDEWRAIDHFPAYKHFQLRVFLQQHNEHRIVFPELILAIDGLLFHARQVFTIAMSCLFYVATWLLLAKSSLSSRTANRFALWCSILSAGIIITWSGSTLVLGTPFQVQWTLVEFAIAAALFSITRIGEFGDPRFRALTVAFAVIATFSSANGLFLWPVLIVSALMLHLRKRDIAVLGISGAVSIALYFTDYRFSSHSSLALAFQHPLFFLGFIATYIGVPFSPVSDQAGIVAGAISFSAFIGFGLYAWKSRQLRTWPGIVLFGFYFMVLLTGVMTAIGRMDPQNPSSLGAAKAHRYIIVPLEGWACLALIAGWLLCESRVRLWAMPLASVLLALFIVNRNPNTKGYVDNPRAAFFTSPQIAALSFETGLEDPGIIRTVFPDVRYVLKNLKVMRRYNLSVFYESREKWLGKSVSSVFKMIYPEPQTGAITVAYPVESGLELLGWSDSPRQLAKLQQLIFANEKQQIIGFGQKLADVFPWGLGSLSTPSSLAWVGFVNLTIPSKAVFAYRIDRRDNEVVQIGNPLSLAGLDGIKSISPEQMGPALPNLRWQIQGAWEKNGPLIAKPLGDAPAGDQFESWTGSDSDTGELLSDEFDAPNGCLVIPVAHGPSVDKLHVNVIDANSSAILKSVPLFGVDGSWRYWQLHVSEATSRVKIVAEDHGNNWGQWLALGEPHACR